MSGKLLQLNFKFSATPDEYEREVAPLASDFAQVNGLRWKIWIMNSEAREAGGIYLFDNQEAVGEFLAGSLATGVKNHPALYDFSAKVFDVMDDVTAVTRDPGTGGVR